MSFTTQGITYDQQDWGNTKFHKLCDKDTKAYHLDSLYNFPLWAKPADRLFRGSVNKNPLCHCTYECILVGSSSPTKSLGDHSPGRVCNYRGNMMHCHLAKLVSEFWLPTGESAKAFCFQSLIWWFIIFFYMAMNVKYKVRKDIQGEQCAHGKSVCS